MSMKNKPAWHETATALAILYFIEERGKRFSVALDRDEAFLEDVLTRMYRADLLDIDADRGYFVTDKGRRELGKLVAMYDQVRQFNIFANVDLEHRLKPKDQDESNPNLPWDNLHDPRFGVEGDGGIDLRLAMITFFRERGRQDGANLPEVDPHLVVFTQKLIDGELAGQTFWFDLAAGAFFRDVEQIVESAYRWRSLDPRSEAGAIEAAEILYAAGMVEAIKRAGDECGRCGTPLGMFEHHAQADGHSLDECPNPDCAAPLSHAGPAAPTATAAATRETCPNCRAEIGPRDRHCRGCGAEIDRSLAAGTVAEDVVEEERVVWTHGYDYYGYVPVVLDPFFPFVAFAEGACFGLAVDYCLWN